MCTSTTCTDASRAGVTTANGGITGSGSLYASGRMLNNNGTATLSGGNLYLNGVAIMNNSGTINLSGEKYSHREQRRHI